MNYDATAGGELIERQPAPAYQKVNGCTTPMPLWQGIALGVVLVIEVLSFDLIRSMIQTASILLYVLFALNYIVLLFVIIDYLILLFSDPADPRLKHPSYSEPNEKLVHCGGCKSNVSQSSYHCNTCKRCVQGFDHHCVFLNNCIGKQNYSTFFRLLLTTISHMSLNMGIGFSMFMTLTDAFKWVALTYAALSFLVFLEITVLAIFHCYISFVLYKSTLEVIRGKKEGEGEGEEVNAARTVVVCPSLQTNKKPQPKTMESHVQEQRTEVGLHKPAGI